MQKSLFQHNFDAEAYLKKRVLEIQNLEDRRLFKEVMEKLFLQLYRYTEQAYSDQEKRIFGEMRSSQNDFAVSIGIVDKDHYDATDPFLVPINPADVPKREILTAEMLRSLKEKQEYRLYTVFLQAGYPVAKEFGENGRKYHGTVKTEHAEYRAEISVKKENWYLKKVKELYYIFIENFRPWVAVCDAYLNKLFCVNLCAVENPDPKETIREITVDFEEYAKDIRYHMIPLWNLMPLVEKTSAYPEPCVDRINYEHRIFSNRLDPDDQYLVTNTDREITNIRRLNGDLLITCPEEVPCRWSLYRINRKPEQISCQYPVLSNCCGESFAAVLSGIFRKGVKTKSEIARLVRSYGYEKYVTLCKVEFLSSPPKKEQTYDMDFFIQDELRSGNSSNVMCLSFQQADPGNYLNTDIMSFLVTQVQKLFPEYHCCGKIM